MSNTANDALVTTTWWWVRHAPVREDGGKIYGQSDLGCDCSDTAVFKGLARTLPKDAVWFSSNLKRTTLTAAAIWDAGFPKPAKMPAERDFAEQNLGDWQGRDRAAFYASRPVQLGSHWFGPADEQTPNGESFLDLYARVGERIRFINNTHAGRNIIAVAHGGVIKAAIALALNLGPQGGLSFAIENCSLTKLDYLTLNGNSGWRVGMVNQQPWLAGDHPSMHQPAGPEVTKLA
ncbi:MAG: histidine phosphatase family protein [Proteobacteria bacterium]|nr:MAG: histidine phosphatase family protein [Pseudomonadota bacterium]